MDMHTPVLLNKVIEYLDPKPGEFVIDGTVDGCGYASAILERLGNSGKFLGIDWDWRMVRGGCSKIKNFEQRGIKISLVNDNFANMPNLLEQGNFGKAEALVLDLGFSSEQLEHSGRGFSFLKDEPLKMTYSDTLEPVKDILKRLSIDELAKIINDFSQERFARRIAEAIKKREKAKPIETAKDLATVIAAAVPKNYERGRIHPATRTFLALRIYANKELENLETILKNLTLILKPGGRIVIVSFHSLEDKLVKNYFRDYAKGGSDPAKRDYYSPKVGTVKILTKKPIVPDREEIKENPRARSAKLRAAIII